jgi:serine/threonine-protein kinase
MTNDRWQQLEELYHAAREDRTVLDKADPELRREVESLLAQQKGADFLESPALEVAAQHFVVEPGQNLAGRRIGFYQILSLLGSGGMGEVYRAKDTKLKREVALKVLPDAFASDPERMARFQREAEVLAALNHPNIAQIYGLEDRALVMELVEGENLPSPLPVETALNYARQIAEALEAAHEKGIIHRDLKPSNIMITAAGVVKVLDFGLAAQSRELEEGESSSVSPTRSGMIIGTPAYMSPEQARGEPVDRRADIWAFGVVLYEMLTGKEAFGRDTPSDTLAAVLKDEPEWDRVPQRAQRLLRRCLEKNPKQRLRDIADAMALIDDTPTGTVPRPRKLPWFVAAALTVIAAVLGFGWWRATRPVHRPLMRFSVDLGPEAVEGLLITAAISPDGTRLAFVARGPGGKEQLATRLLEQAQATLLPGTENAADPFFSPDGQWVGFFADGKMKKISVQGGAVVTLCDASGARGASWGEDGSIIVTLGGGLDGGLSRVPDAGGTPQAITKPGDKGEATHRWPQILPGEAVLFTGHTVLADYDNASIEVLSLKTGKWKTVQRGGYFARYVPSGHLLYIHQGKLFAVGFDLDRLEVRGTPAPLLEDVAAHMSISGGQYDISRNGTFVYLTGVSSTASWPVAWMDSSGKTQPLRAPGEYYAPRFSPDGKRLALSVASGKGGDIQIYDWQHDTMTPLTYFPQKANTLPVWTPDGKHIVFRAQAPGRFLLYWIRTEGLGEAQLLLESKSQLAPYSFSPDGKRLAYSEQNVDTGFDLWTLPLDVSDPEHPKPAEPELFLRTPINEAEPAFSPDGRWIAYTSNLSGRGEVYVGPFAGPPGKVQISNGGGRHPIWSGNGRELFYLAPDSRIIVATYTEKSDSFVPDKPRPWSDTEILDPPSGHRNFDLLPDGKRFAVFPRPDASGEQKGSVHVTVLLNFFDELRRRVPAGGK